jgi:uncharacterized repeat protein (TIGR01451 family)
VLAEISPWAHGTLSNTAQVRAPAQVVELDPKNNSATDHTELTPLVDLQITKTDQRETAVPGQTQLTYTIVVTNAGPSAVQGAWITDDLPDTLLNVRYTSVTSGEVSGHTTAGSGDIDDLVSLGPGATITYTVLAEISPWAHGTLSNTAQVRAPAQVVELDPKNNSATDHTELTPLVDLQITKTDQRETAVPGQTQLTYTIVVTNAGPSAVQGAWITDDLPDTLFNVRYTSVTSGEVWGHTTAGSGDIDDLVSLGPGATITYTVLAEISPWAHGTLSNTAQVRAPAQVVELDPKNNSATDHTELAPLVDLQITKTDQRETAVPGQTQLTYTIVVTNAGPSAVQGAWITDDLPDTLLNVRYTTVTSGEVWGHTTAGSGDIDDLVSLGPGATITYTVLAEISPWAHGTLSNTAQVRAPAQVVELDPKNNSATDHTELAPLVDLQITKTDQRETAVPGQTQLTYTIVVTNAGPSAVQGAWITDDLPDTLLNVRYTSVTSGEVWGNTAAGMGDIFDRVSIGPGAVIVYEVTGSVRASASGLLVNTARVRTPEGVIDLDLTNNAATDVDILVPTGDLIVTLDDGLRSVLPGQVVTYTLVVTNTGPSDALGVLLTDVFPDDLVNVRYDSLTIQGTVTGATSDGSGQARAIRDLLDLSAGAVVSYSITGTVAATILQPLENTARLTAPAGFADPILENNQAVDRDNITPQLSVRGEAATRFEGNEGGTPFTFVVERTGDTSEAVQVYYTVVGTSSTPAESRDFGATLPSGWVSLAPGEASQVLVIFVTGDLEFESNESFLVTLSAPSNAVLSSAGPALGVIQDDDSFFAYSVTQLPQDSDAETSEQVAAAALSVQRAAGDTAAAESESRVVVSDTGSQLSDSTARSTVLVAEEESDRNAQAGEIRLFFVIVDISGRESTTRYELPASLLEGDHLLELFKKFPNGHYRIYLEQDRAVRKLYDLHIYGNQLTTPETAANPAEGHDGGQEAAAAGNPSPSRGTAAGEQLPDSALSGAALVFCARIRRRADQQASGHGMRGTSNGKSWDWSRAGRIMRRLRNELGNGRT